MGAGAGITQGYPGSRPLVLHSLTSDPLQSDPTSRCMDSQFRGLKILISWESWSPAVAKTARCVCRRHLIGLQLPSTRIDKVIIYRINIVLLFLQQAGLAIMGENGYGISFTLFAYFFLPSFRIFVSVTRVISSGQGSG